MNTTTKEDDTGLVCQACFVFFFCAVNLIVALSRSIRRTPDTAILKAKYEGIRFSRTFTGIHSLMLGQDSPVYVQFSIVHTYAGPILRVYRHPYPLKTHGDHAPHTLVSCAFAQRNISKSDPLFLRYSYRFRRKQICFSALC
jgi:hypothetical protein